MKINYSDQLKLPQWQKKRLEILERDNFKCVECGNSESELNVHHRCYIENRMVWDYHHLLLVTLCNECHKNTHNKIKQINDRIGFMTKDQLYFTIDIINMLQLATPEQALKTLEYLTSELKNTIHE